jgi:hypothetical protein
MDSLTRPFWPEPTGVRGKPDGTPITITGELAYVVRHVSAQGRAYMTGVLRTTAGDGEIPFEVPPVTYSHVGGLMAEAEIRTVTGRIDRRGPVHLLTVGDVEAVES